MYGDSELRPAPGYIVPPTFWRYINRAELFPGTWLHDIGLPMTDAFTARVYKYGEWRDIVVQAFERTVLTNDPKNPREWQIERGNIGADALRTLPQPESPIAIPAAGARVTLRSLTIQDGVATADSAGFGDRGRLTLLSDLRGASTRVLLGI